MTEFNWQGKAHHHHLRGEKVKCVLKPARFMHLRMLITSDKDNERPSRQDEEWGIITIAQERSIANVKKKRKRGNLVARKPISARLAQRTRMCVRARSGELAATHCATYANEGRALLLRGVWEMDPGCCQHIF